MIDFNNSFSNTILLNENKASAVTGFKVTTLRKRRWQGLPPRFLKVGSKVFYDANELQLFLQGCVRESTSQKDVEV